MTYSIDSLYIYPVKSCRGFEVEQAELIETGFRHDRHWMLIDEQGDFLSQRRLPRMTLIRTRLLGSELLCSNGEQEIAIPTEQKPHACREVAIWNDRCQAALVSPAASRWFSEQLDTSCDLVYLPASERRLVDPAYAHRRQIVSFADGFPLLVITRQSIALLNEKLSEDLSIERFRPNIVIAGGAAHQEDEWRSIRVGDIDIDLVKPCSRCVIPSIDPDDAKQHATLNRTLAGYRRRDGKIMFGMNGLHRQTGPINKGMAIEATPA